MASLDATVNVGKFINLAERKTTPFRQSFSGNPGLVGYLLVVCYDAFLYRKIMRIVYRLRVFSGSQAWRSHGSKVGDKDLCSFPFPVIFLFIYLFSPFRFSLLSIVDVKASN